MSRDLYSAIVFCAQLSAQRRLKHDQVCVRARPFLSMLFQTKRQHVSRHSRQKFDPANAFTVQVETSRLGFFDPSFVPHGFESKKARELLRNAVNKDLCSSSLRRQPKHIQNHLRSNYRRLHDTSTSPWRGRAMSTDPRQEDIQHTKAVSKTQHRKNKKYTPQQRLDQALQSGAQGERLAFYKQRLDPVVRLIEKRPHQLSLPDQLRLCFCLLLAAHANTTSGESPKQFTPDKLRSDVQWPRWSSPWAVLLAHQIWTRIESSDLRGSSELLFYAQCVRAQIYSFFGQLSEAEAELNVLINDEVHDQAMVLQTLRAYIFSARLHGKVEEALFLVCRHWERLSVHFIGTGLSIPTTTRQYSDLLRKEVLNMFGEIEGITRWYAGRRSTNKREKSRLDWDESTHQRVGLLAFLYLSRRFSAIEDGPRYGRVQQVVAETAKLIKVMRDAGYTLPSQLLLKFSINMASTGHLRLSELFLELYNHQLQTNPTDESAKELDTYSRSAQLVLAARKGDILQALDLVASLQKDNGLSKKDVRNLIQSYLEAPLYDLQSPTILPDLVASPSVDRSNPPVDPTPSPSSFNLPDRLKDAEEIFEVMLMPHGPSVSDYIPLLEAYARSGNVDKVTHWIERMLSDGISSDAIPWNTALRAFANTGNAHAAAKVLEYMHSIEVQRRQKGKVATDEVHGARGAISAQTLDILLNLMIRRRDPQNATRLWEATVINRGVHPSPNTILKLMRVYADSGQWASVTRIWTLYEEDLLVAPTVSHGGNKTDKNMDSSVVAAESEQRTSLYNIVLRAFVAIGAPYITVQRVFQNITEQSAFPVEPNAYSMTMMIISACDAGMMDDAVHYFQLMDDEERRRGLSNVERLRSGIKPGRTRKLSTTRHLSSYRPIYALTHILAGFVKQGKFDGAEWVYQQLRRRGLRLLPLTYALIIRTFIESDSTGNLSEEEHQQSLQSAERFLARLFEERSEKGDSMLKGQILGREIVAGPLLDEYVKRMRPEKVERLLEQITTIGDEPSITILTRLMDAYRRSGNIERVEETWERIITVTQALIEMEETTVRSLTGSNATDDHGGMEPNQPSTRAGVLRATPARRMTLCYPLSIYMDAMSDAGRQLDVARQWQRLRDAGFAFDAHNWNQLILVLLRAGEVERGFEVVENILSVQGEEALDVRLDGGDENGIKENWGMEWGRRVSRMETLSHPEIMARSSLLLEARTDGGSRDKALLKEVDHLRRIVREEIGWRLHNKARGALQDILGRLQAGQPLANILADEREGEVFDPQAIVTDPSEAPEARKLYMLLVEKYPRALREIYSR